MQQPKLRFKGFNDEWKPAKLGQHLDFIGSGVTPRGGSSVYKKKEGIILIRSQNVHFAGLKLEDIAFITPEINEKMKKSEVYNLDVLLNITGASIGRTAMVPLNFPKANVNQHVCILRPNNQLAPFFLKTFLESSKGQKNIFKDQAGQTREALNLQQIKDFSIGIPSIDEQQKISSFFILLNEKIEKQQEKIKKLEQFKKDMLQKIFSQELRFKGEDGAEFPAWYSLEFGDVVEKLIGGGTPSRQIEEYYGGSIPWVTVKDLKTNKYVFDAMEYITELGLENSSSKIVDPGDLIIPTRMAVGRVLIATEQVAINQDLKGCKLKSDYDTEFIYYLYFSKSSSIEKLGSGSTVTGINIDQLMKIKIQVPTLAEQKRVADYLGKLDKKLEKEKEKLMVLEEQKKGFMQGMFV